MSWTVITTIEKYGHTIEKRGYPDYWQGYTCIDCGEEITERLSWPDITHFEDIDCE